MNMNSKMGALFKILIALVAIFIAARIYYYLTDDFRISNITYEMPYEASWQIPPLNPQEEANLDKILDQPWTYLGKGAQSYVFKSEDGRYVLKFFKFKHLRPSWFHDLIPSIGPLKDYKAKQEARKQRKLYGVFQSYKLAYDIDKEASGLNFIQLNVKGNPKRTVVVTDKLGIKRTINLEDVPFILQDQGQTFRNVLTELLQNGDVVTAEHRIGQILDMYAEEYKKGIFDHDHGVMQNTGFVGDRPLHLDVGKLLPNDAMKQKENAKQDAQVVAKNINEWIEKKYPKYKERVSKYIENKLHQLYD